MTFVIAMLLNVISLLNLVGIIWQWFQTVFFRIDLKTLTLPDLTAQRALQTEWMVQKK